MRWRTPLRRMRHLKDGRSAAGCCFFHNCSDGTGVTEKMQSPSQNDSNSHGLIRGMGLGSATALNMIDMIGVGPFITMPLVLSAMGGPQALPGSGGPYRYLNEIYGPRKWGRLISFLFIWQLSFSAPLSIATGCIGLAGYAAYYWP